MELLTHAWADGFGVWHVSIPLSLEWLNGNTDKAQAEDAHAAREAIRAELIPRAAPNWDSSRLDVIRERLSSIPGHVIYKEVWPD